MGLCYGPIPEQEIFIMREMVSRHREKIMYLIVGMWNTAFGYGLFAGLYYLLSKSMDYNIILLMSYVVSTISAYLLYKYLVFRTQGGLIRGYLRFSVVYVYAYLGNMLILFGLKRFTSIDLYLGQYSGPRFLDSCLSW
jgi:putative flippase GtrA